ncbi:MAG: isoprenylcysteine carboxylmethyltransferase family protein [Deltaproteobacteria bacterium]|nr:isoprenylcysteine carboxylmethyltransferase family protein [Deltaproteobacteria bacterium]
MEDLLFAFAIAAYVVAGFAWPVLRLWRRHRIWPIVFNREAVPAQRVLGLLSAALLVGALALGALYAALGSDALGVRRLPLAGRVAGWLLLVGGSVLTLAAQRQMGVSWRIGIDDRPTDLVTTGVFRHVRNPIFTGLLALMAGIVLLSPAWWSGVMALLTALAVRLQVAFEEQHLSALHGDAYLAYAARAGRFIPFAGRLPRPPARRSDNASAALTGEVKS